MGFPKVLYYPKTGRGRRGATLRDARIDQRGKKKGKPVSARGEKVGGEDSSFRRGGERPDPDKDS